MFYKTSFEDTKGVVRSRKSKKDRRYKERNDKSTKIYKALKTKY